jgi:hypothetical protein
MTYNSEVTYLFSTGNLPSSILTAKFEAFLLMPRTYLQKDRCKFSIGMLSIKLNKYTWYLLFSWPRKASNLAVRIELGRLPVENFIKSQTLLYFARLYATKLNPLLKEFFLLCQNIKISKCLNMLPQSYMS